MKSVLLAQRVVQRVSARAEKVNVVMVEKVDSVLHQLFLLQQQLLQQQHK
jgi:hypothetical protein